jgi:hypothetical protein
LSKSSSSKNGKICYRINLLIGLILGQLGILR